MTAIELPTVVIQFIGQHNQRNLATILGVLSTVGMSLSDAKKALKRMHFLRTGERIYNHCGMQIINDSKAKICQQHKLPLLVLMMKAIDFSWTAKRTI